MAHSPSQRLSEKMVPCGDCPTKRSHLFNSPGSSSRTFNPALGAVLERASSHGTAECWLMASGSPSLVQSSSVQSSSRCTLVISSAHNVVSFNRSSVLFHHE